MCFSNDYIEHQARRMTDEIRNHSIYKFVGVDYFSDDRNNNSHLPEQANSGNVTPLKELGLISKVFLEGKDSTLYTIEPNMNGLRFAKGEISYNKFKKLQRKNDTTICVSFLGIIGFFIVSMLLLSKFI